MIGRTDGNGLLTSTNAQPIVRHNIFLENGRPVRRRNAERSQNRFAEILARAAAVG